MLIRVVGNDYSAKVIVGFTTGNQTVLYDVVDFKATKFSIKKERTHQGYAEAGSPRKDAFSISSIFNSVENVNRENIQNNNKAIKTLIESVSGDELLNAEDLIDEVRTVGGEVNNN